MKKISILSVLSIIAMPAMAQEIINIYGDEPMYAPKSNSVEPKMADVVEHKTEIESEKIPESNAIHDEPIADNHTPDVAIEEPLSKDVASQFDKQTTNPKIKFPHGLQLGVGVSPTSGLNGFVGYNNKNFDSFWAKRFGVRFDFATYSPIKSKLNRKINDAVDDKGVEIEDNLKIDNLAINAKHYGAIIDFYPFGDTWFLGGWRLSGGYMTGKLDIDADIHGKNLGDKIEFELGGQKYSYDGTVMHGHAAMNWKYSGPYAGTGFDMGLVAGLKLYFDAGVVFTNNHAKIDLNVPMDGLKDANGNTVSGNATLEAAYNDAKAKALNDAQKELNKINAYPIVKMGFMYRF